MFILDRPLALALLIRLVSQLVLQMEKQHKRLAAKIVE